jgi:hypothetical protein
MPEVEFNNMIPVFERVKTVYALDRAAAVMGSFTSTEKCYASVFCKIWFLVILITEKKKITIVRVYFFAHLSTPSDVFPLVLLRSEAG